jgi:hypothetical protein
VGKPRAQTLSNALGLRHLLAGSPVARFWNRPQKRFTSVARPCVRQHFPSLNYSHILIPKENLFSTSMRKMLHISQAS